jgi:hypothetical protein
VLLLLFQEKNPNELMREVQMNEFSVNFERLILGKFAKGSEPDIVSAAHHVRSTRARSPVRSWAEARIWCIITENEKSKIPQGTELVLHQANFYSIV